MAVISGDVVLGKRKPVFTVLLIAVNVAVYIHTTGYLLASTLPAYLASYGYRPVYALCDLPRAIETVLTSMFMHADIFHLFFNMLFLWVFGSRLEKLIGHLKFLALYFASGFSAVAFHTAFTAIGGLEALGIPAIGASGAISGVLGAYLMLLPRTRIVLCMFFFFMPYCFRLPAYVYLLIWFAQQVIYGYMVLGGVAYFAHVGGFVLGLALSPLLARGLRIRRAYFDESLFRYMEEVLGVLLPRRVGLGKWAKALLAALLLAVVAGYGYGYAVLTSGNYLVYAMSVSASINGDFQNETTAFYAVNGEVALSPAVLDNTRIFVNRLASDVILNKDLAGKTIQLQKRYSVYVQGVEVGVVLVGSATYDENGVLVYSSGVAKTNVVVLKGYYWARGEPVEISYVLESQAASLDALKALCMLSAAVTALALLAVFTCKGVGFYGYEEAFAGPLI